MVRQNSKFQDRTIYTTEDLDDKKKKVNNEPNKKYKTLNSYVPSV